jgi:hypothetical protein
MSEDINHGRRRFLGTAVLTMAAAELVRIGAAGAQPSETKPAAVPTVKPGTHTSFGALQQIEAGVLHVGYAEAGPAGGPAVMLLHGWYQFYFATARGRAGYEQYRRDFAKLIWPLASPQWDFDAATFSRTAAAFDNPDHVGT